MSNYCQSIECDDCRSEERDEMAEHWTQDPGAVADHLRDEDEAYRASCEHEARQATLRDYGKAVSDLFMATRRMEGLGLTHADYKAWRAPVYDTSLPF
jgi:hypothetical protein